MKKSLDQLNEVSHRRKNILTNEWILVSPNRTKRPWQGEVTEINKAAKPNYDPDCYLCPGNIRANGEKNPNYENTFVFTNDFSSLVEETPKKNFKESGLLVAKSEKGICRVVNFSPNHGLTLAEMNEKEIEKVINVWQDEYEKLGKEKFINYVQIFENKGAMMGNSNPHPHCQIWAQQRIPMEPKKETTAFKKYFKKRKTSLLKDYLKVEMKCNERIVYENYSFIVLVPFWATWPFETLIIPKKKIPSLLYLKENEAGAFANAIKVITSKYDKIFNVSFPYSSGIHQSPTDGLKHPEWHMHMHFYPPLLRSSSIKKFMVGYEMLAEPQRDISPEQSAKILKDITL